MQTKKQLEHEFSTQCSLDADVGRAVQWITV